MSSDAVAAAAPGPVPVVLYIAGSGQSGGAVSSVRSGGCADG